MMARSKLSRKEKRLRISRKRPSCDLCSSRTYDLHYIRGEREDGTLVDYKICPECRKDRAAKLVP